MASSLNIRPFIQKWEGGLSRNTTDTASSTVAPWAYKGVNGYHTNKGVTYKTFIGLAPKLGYAVTADNFFTMPNNIWDSIFKTGYWDPWHLDKLKSQALADLIVCFSWGSGLAGSFKSVKKYLTTKGLNVSTKLEAVEALNKISFLNEKNIFLELIDHREIFFRSLSTFSTFGKGWLNRLNDLKKIGLETLNKKKIKIVAITLLVIVIVFSIYSFYYKPSKN